MWNFEVFLINHTACMPVFDQSNAFLKLPQKHCGEATAHVLRFMR